MLSYSQFSRFLSYQPSAMLMGIGTRRQYLTRRRVADAKAKRKLDLMYRKMYFKELRAIIRSSRGLKVKRQSFSYRNMRIGGQNIMPRVLYQSDNPTTHFMATTSCVETRYRRYLALTQEKFGEFEGMVPPSSLFEQLAWQEWTPEQYMNPDPTAKTTGDWWEHTLPITESGIGIQREFLNGTLLTRYRVANLTHYILNGRDRSDVTNEEMAQDWAKLTSELIMNGPFVGVFRPDQTWLVSNGKTIYGGPQGEVGATPYAVLVSGFRRTQNERLFEIMNAQGYEWGRNGYGWLHMDCLGLIIAPSIVPLNLGRENIHPCRAPPHNASY